jgi:hypothetical protein
MALLAAQLVDSRGQMIGSHIGEIRKGERVGHASLYSTFRAPRRTLPVAPGAAFPTVVLRLPTSRAKRASRARRAATSAGGVDARLHRGVQRNRCQGNRRNNAIYDGCPERASSRAPERHDRRAPRSSRSPRRGLADTGGAGAAASRPAAGLTALPAPSSPLASPHPSSKPLLAAAFAPAPRLEVTVLPSTRREPAAKFDG